MNLSPRLMMAKWAIAEAQATLDRSDAIRRGESTAALDVWIEICVMRRSYWVGVQAAPSA